MKIYTSNILLGLIVMILFFMQPGSAQTSDELKSLKKEFEELKETQKTIQKDLQEIKNLLVRYSTTLGLDVIKYQECLDSGRYANEIRKEFLEGQKATVRGTPTFFIGISEGEDTNIKLLKLIRGAKPYIEFKQAFDSLLTPQK